MPRYFILSMYPLLFGASVLAAHQSRKLSHHFPSRAWTLKFRLMVFFMLVQIFGSVKLLFTVREYHWIDCVYLACVLIFFLGVNYFDYLLLSDYRKLRTRLAKVALIPVVPLSGDLPPDFWVKTFTAVVRGNVRDEFLKPQKGELK